MSDELSHPWGIPIEAYIQTLDKPRLNKRVPSRTEVISALQKVYNQSLSVSCTTFEDILAVVLYPDEMAEIAQRSNALSSSCVKLLRDHSTQAGGLLNYQYGYLGLRVLVLSLLITFVGYTSPGETAHFGYEKGSIDRIMRQLTAKTSLCLDFGLSLHAAPPEDIWHRSSDSKSLGSLMDWNGNMTNIELDDLFSLLVAERSSFFNLCSVLRNTQGWTLLLLVLWIRVAPGCDLDNKTVAAHPNDFISSTTSLVDTVLRQLTTLRLLSPILSRDGCHTSCYLLTAFIRLKAPPTFWQVTDMLEGDPPGVDRLRVSLGFITGYQTHSDFLDDLDIPLMDLALARPWAVVQSDRTFVGDGMVGRYDVCKLAHAVFRNVAFPILRMNPVALRGLKLPELVELRHMAIRYSTALQEAGLVDLMGRIILMPILRSEFRQDIDASLLNLGLRWSHMAGYIDYVPGLLREYHKEAIDCFHDDYATWLKVLYFLRAQDRSTSPREQYFAQRLTRWLRFGQDLGFLTNIDQRCAYIGCIGSVPLHPESLLCCSRCLTTYYCSPQCQVRDWEIRNTNSHRMRCIWNWSEAQQLQQAASHKYLRPPIEDLEGWHVGMMGEDK
ncbi:hypothetical protein FRC12_024992 [Ceratobasidium sp. 428]|nr:hypothetical protein FRC12_024992 [Ceratobasidium sp. 428]